MCPACIANIVIFALGATSTGGVATLKWTKLFAVKNEQGKTSQTVEKANANQRDESRSKAN
jgi:hypothetical protein